MSNASRNHLFLVEPPAELEPPDLPTDDPIPFCIRLTIDQVLDLADEADLRAQILHWSAQETSDGAGTSDRVHSLRDVAIELRGVASHLKGCWSEVGRSS